MSSFPRPRRLGPAAACFALLGLAAADLTEVWETDLPKKGEFGGIATAADNDIFAVLKQGKTALLQRYGPDGKKERQKKLRGLEPAAVVTWDAVGGGASSESVEPATTAVFVASHDGGTSATTRLIVTRHDGKTLKEVWRTEFEDFGLPHDIDVTPGGEYVYVTGWFNESFNPNTGAINDDLFLVQVRAADGVVGFTTTYDGDDVDIGHGVRADPRDMGVWVVGETGRTSRAPFTDMLIQKYDHTGKRKWNQIVDGPGGGFDRGFGIAVAPSGKKAWAAGYMETGQNDLESQDIVVQQITSKGKLQKRRSIDLLGAGPERATDIEITADGKTLVVAGFTCPRFFEVCDAFVLTTNTRGRQRGQALYSPPGNDTALGDDVEVSADGSFVFGGSTEDKERVWIHKYRE